MKKRALLSLAFVALVTAAWAIALAAHPGSINCPTDGQAMTYDHFVVGSNQFGPGPHNTCWYKHEVLWNGKRETHTAYVPCDN